MRETPTSLILALKRHGGDEAEIVWSAIERITAFKQDLFDPQIVVLEIRTPGGCWEIDAADCGGFAPFSHLLSARLPGMPAHAQWWPKVTDPLGRQEEHILFQRSG
jgi:hypothetical protein